MTEPVDWTNVKAPEPEPEPKKSSKIWGILAFLLFLVALVVGGGGFLATNMLGSRIKDRAIAQCDGTPCVIEVRSNHDKCFSDHLTLAAPQSADDFQTNPESDHFGPATVDWPAYRKCAGFEKPKTLEDAEKSP